ncbi:E3 ubiquitin-protein ligase RING1-like [Nosema granulosis]|uniref:E3 ubiquitin-protein ligase RING1-like n=1 Tax=Nosema granulosis TaxID=83296 RepID=A0A9P6KZI3_9MICR|nr:E3 ubiquitin-protein ligase RING1-like [Nosema granulosis]
MRLTSSEELELICSGSECSIDNEDSIDSCFKEESSSIDNEDSIDSCFKEESSSIVEDDTTKDSFFKEESSSIDNNDTTKDNCFKEESSSIVEDGTSEVEIINIVKKPKITPTKFINNTSKFTPTKFTQNIITPTKFINSKALSIDFEDCSLLNVTLNNKNEKYKSSFYKDLLNKQSTNCSICLVEFRTHSKTITLLCTHLFHSKCIIPWIKEHKRCPCCRTTA